MRLILFIISMLFTFNPALANFSCLRDLLEIKRLGSNAFIHGVLPSRIQEALSSRNASIFNSIMDLRRGDPVALSYTNENGDLNILDAVNFVAIESEGSDIVIKVRGLADAGHRLSSIPLKNIFNLYPEHLHDFNYLLLVHPGDYFYFSRMDNTVIHGGIFQSLDNHVNIGYRQEGVLERLSLEGDPVRMIHFHQGLSLDENAAQILARFYFNMEQYLFDTLKDVAQANSSSSFNHRVVRQYFINETAIFKNQLILTSGVRPETYAVMIGVVDDMLLPRLLNILNNVGP